MEERRNDNTRSTAIVKQCIEEKRKLTRSEISTMQELIQ